MSSSSVPNNPFFLGTQIQSSSTGSDSRRISSSLVDETRKLDEYKPPEAKRLRSNFSSPQKAGILKAATRASIPNMDEAPANECDAKKFSGTLMESEEPVHDARIYRRSSILTRNVAQTNTKKLVIHGFKQNVPGNAEESDPFETKWHPLEVAVLAIQKKMKAEISLEQLYEVVEYLCSTCTEMRMYEKLKGCMVSHVIQELQALLTSFESTQLFLQRLNTFWLEFCEQLINVRSVFLYLDRTFILQNASVMSLWDLGLEIYRDEVMHCGHVRKRSTEGLLKIIEEERAGVHVDRLLIRSLVRMLISLRVYTDVWVFEKQFLEATNTLYESEGRHLSQTLDVPDYLKHVKKRLEEESERVDYYLDSVTRKPLMMITEKCLIADHMDSFINKGLDAMLHENKPEDLSLMYDLVLRTKNGLNILKNVFVIYIKKVGRSLVMDFDRDKTLVSDLLNMKRRLDNVVDSCFQKNEKFIQAEKDAFDYFINTRPNKPAELVAKYMDVKLRNGNRSVSEEEMESLMDEVIVLFRFIHGKDVFEAFYKKDLAKRLLLGKSASVDAEKSMLSKLKQECGAAFTTRLEGMFKDIEISKDLGVAFKQHLESNETDGTPVDRRTSEIEFNVNVLTMGHWPTYEYMDVAIPPVLAVYQEDFQKFYFSKHSGRKLQWQHSLGQLILRAQFSVVKELQVTMFQALVLLLFNEKVEWSYEEILSTTKIEKNELNRTMQSLACGKFRVLKKSPRNKIVKDADIFTFNPDCSEKLFRIRISQVQMKETEVERAHTEEEIYQDRQYQIDAAIVRIMKTRRTLAHQLLISELFKQLRFPVKPIDLKKRIESLIEREYMCRDQDEANIYNYLA